MELCSGFICVHAALFIAGIQQPLEVSVQMAAWHKRTGEFSHPQAKSPGHCVYWWQEAM